MNKKTRAFKIIYFTLIFSLILSIITSCKSQEEKPKPPEEKKDEIPKGLTSIEEKTEEVLEKIEKLQEEIKKPPEPKKEEKEKEESKEKEDKQQEGEEEGGGKEEEKSKNGEEGSDKEKDMTKEEKIKKMREEITKNVEGIHSTWNNYEHKAVEDGASSEDIKEFEDSLNKLTIGVENENNMMALYSINNMTLYMAKYFDIYKGNPDGEILRLKYYVRQMYLNGESGKWDEVSGIIPKLEETIARIRQKVELPKEKKSLMDKLNLSIEDLQNSIKEKNNKLLKIKRDIVLKNLEEIREEAK